MKHTILDKYSKNFKSFVRLFSNTTIKPFNSIPGPKSLPIFGTLWAYLPIIGRYKFDRLHWNGLLKLKQYGPLVKEDIIPGISIVWVFKPDDIETVYRCEGRYPERRSHLALAKYRTDRPHLYNSAGLLSTNGPEWGRIRNIFQQDISKIQNVRFYLQKSDEIIKSFLDSCISSTIHDNFLPELSRLFLELIGFVVFDESLNSFSERELKSDSRTSKLIEAAATINKGVLKTDDGLQLWKKFETPLYRRIAKAHSYIESIAQELMEKKLTKRCSENSTRGQSLLEKFVLNEDCDKKDILGITVDMLLAGIDTLAFTCSYAFYLISKNTDKQEILFDELRNVMSKDDQITEEMLSKTTYTKAIMKEVFRLYPISIGVGRILAKDAILSQYHVPAGTIVVTQNQVTCRLPEYFVYPNEFIPERWSRISSDQKIHPYVVLPFGHGPRSCIARRLAEQNIQLLIMNTFRKFRVTWMGEELDCRSVQINEPDKNIKLQFETRIT